MVADNGAAFLAMKVAFITGTLIAIKCLDKTSGAGPTFDAVVTKFDRSEPIEGHITYSVEVKPTYSAHPPTWADA
jgi:hypothetical protein